MIGLKSKILVMASLILASSSMSTMGQKLSGNEMDFWLGEWNLTLMHDSLTGEASNSVTRILDGNVIKEHYRGKTGIWEGYNGESFTVFDQRLSSFFQTWVANNNGGVYADYSFELDGDQRIFQRETWIGPAQKLRVRMVFHSITADNFIWDWQQSDNEGASWQTLSSVKYERKKEFSDNNDVSFDWLVGRWTDSSKNITEVWKKSDNGSEYTGYSVSFNENSEDSTLLEEMRILFQDGNYYYKASPSGQSRTLFQMISVNMNSFLTYNPDHDFPKRIEYYLTSKNSLKAVIKDESRSMTFNFIRSE